MMKKVFFFLSITGVMVPMVSAQTGWHGNGPRWMYNSTETMYYGTLGSGGTGFSFCYSLKNSGGLEIWPRYVYAKGTWNFQNPTTVSTSNFSISTGGLFNVIGETTGAVNTKGIYVDNTSVADYYGYGVYAESNLFGVYGRATGTGTHSYYGVFGNSDGTNTGTNYGVYGSVLGATINYGVYGYGYGGAISYGVYGYASGGTSSWAGYFFGNVRVTGILDNTKSEVIMDHPGNPEEKYLVHDTVISNEMTTVYNGTVFLDNTGRAVVHLPPYVQQLNRDFRYQLTPIGKPSPNLYIEHKVRNNQFTIAGGEPGMEVSWQLTGVRNDAYARHHPTTIEQPKKKEDQGYYIDPEAFGLDETYGIDYHRQEHERSEQERMRKEDAGKHL